MNEYTTTVLQRRVDHLTIAMILVSLGFFSLGIFAGLVTQELQKTKQKLAAKIDDEIDDFGYAGSREESCDFSDNQKDYDRCMKYDSKYMGN